jgi:hypothetical protein
MQNHEIQQQQISQISAKAFRTMGGERSDNRLSSELNGKKR